jgi:sugar lactone lactonase YvrE
MHFTRCLIEGMGYSMRFFGQIFRSSTSAFKLGIAFFPLAICVLPAAAQTAPPYVLPYTLSTYAGAHAAYTVGQACANGIGFALDTEGDGCMASSVTVGIDPHDLRVDGKGNLYWEDNTSSAGIVHKIDPYNQLETVYFGNLVSLKACALGDKFGNGCTSTDGAANTGPTLFTPIEKANRGLSVALNGDLLLAGYNLSVSQKIAASNNLTTLVTGNGTASYVDGAAKSGQVSSPRGISEDTNGNIYIADTGNNVLRVLYNGFGTIPPVYNESVSTAPVVPVAGNVYTITATNAAATKAVSNNTPAISSTLQAPEDVQIDTFGNLYIADMGNSVIRAIYMGKGSLPGVSNPVFGNIYTIAGNVVAGVGTPAVNGYVSSTLPASLPTYTYPTDGTTPTVPATSVAIGVRKISLDALNNLYITDTSWNVIWFVDHATGDIRLLAGRYFSTAVPAPATPAQVAPGLPAIGCGNGSAIGDGCPGPEGSFNGISTNAGIGASPDNQGNYYFSDPEGASNAAGSRLRKLVSGLNFPTLTVGAAAVTQNVDIHFAPGDTPATANPFTIPGTNTDFKLGTPTCTVQADTTDDCILPISFSPTQSGFDTATLVVNAVKGGTANVIVTGTGTAPSIAFDPGVISLSGATISNSQAVALDGAGNTYIADTANNRILLTTAAGATTVIAGGNGAGYSGDGGLATAATLKGPRGVAIDTSGNVYIADTGNNVIRKVGASGIISTYAGGASAVCSQANNTRGDGCPGLQATFSAPVGLVADNFGQLYVADSGNNVIRQISLTTNVTTFAGGAATVCTTAAGATDTLGDGCSANATVFLSPTGLAFDATGQNIFVADTGDNVVRKISLNNTITTKNSGTTILAASVLVNPVTLVAGNGQAGKSVDSGNLATASQLSGPTGVSVDAAGNTYIADTGNSAIRLVNTNGGLISTIVGILGSSGTGSVTGSAVAAQLNAPAAVSVSPSGTLTILDSGNNRVLVDARSTTTYNFGRVNVLTPSPVQNFTELNIGTITTGTFTVVPSGDTTQFTFAPAATSNGAITACATSLAPGAICNFQGQFNPLTTNTFTAVFTETGTNAAGASPSITLIGIGASLTTTTAKVTQTVPATGNSQFGGSVTLTATITPTSCNNNDPSCTPTGTVSFVVDGTATASVPLVNGSASQMQQSLAVGQHTISCNYGGDENYAASSCANLIITVGKASTTSVVTATNNSKPQFTPVVLTATVTSNTTGIPTGTVTFLANGVTLGTASLGGATGIASFTLQRTLDANGNITFDNTLLPGTYNITCTYNGAANYATSNCAALSFIVAPQPVDFTLVTRGCSVSALDEVGTATPGEGVACNPGPENFNAGAPLVSVAQGSTTDVSIFVNPNNTLSGTLSFSCSGLPANSTCTFSPTTVTLVAGTATALPIPVDMTLWTDLQPGAASLTAPALRADKSGVSLALMLGWPLTLLGLAGIFRFRRKAGAIRGLTLLALLMMITGSSLVFTGCGSGGPGAYQPNLTPTGTYPITVKVTGTNISHTTVIYWTVTGPGIPGQE